jgi:hypothetical protein
MGLTIGLGLGVLLAGLTTAWLLLYRPLRQYIEEVRFGNARVLFRQRREWLEVHFLRALGAVGSEERLRWEEAHWHDEVIWARDRQTGRLLALIGVHFNPPFDDSQTHESSPHHATALFEFRGGHWHAEGKRLNEIDPAEAVLRHQRFEAVVLHQPRRG